MFLRNRRTLAASAAAGLFAWGFVPAPAQAAPAEAVHTQADNNIAAYNDFSTWLGTPVQHRVVFAANDGGWPAIAHPYVLPYSQTWVTASTSHYEVISLPLVPDSDAGNFAAIVAGSHDADFQALGTDLTTRGIASRTVIRLGWEANGNWYSWSYLNNPTGFKNAFRRAVQQIRVTAPSVKITWCLNRGSSNNSAGQQVDWTTVYPGDDVVDYIGIDAYDNNSPNGWSDLLNTGNPGLQALRTFAQAHGKPESYDEWSCSTDYGAGAYGGHGDDTSYVQNMYNWLNTPGANVVYQGYWNTASGGPNAAIQGPDAGNVPNSAALYKTLFGPVAIPSAPTGLSASAGSAQVTLSWTATAGAAGYNIYRGTTTGGESTTAISTGVTTTNFVDTGRTNGTTYYYKVKAVNSAGTSGYSNEASATPNASATDLAQGKTITASSTQGTGFEANKANDGNSTTRWSSLYSSPQTIYVDLGATYNINRVQLNWETAYSVNYTIETSTNASRWTVIKTVTGNATSGVHNYTGLTGSGRYVRINSTAATTANPNISLYDFQVYGTSGTPASTLISQSQPIMASSTQGTGFEANLANDGSTTTRWSSVFSSPQWIYINLGNSKHVTEVKLNWETAYSVNYTIQTSNDASTWTTIQTVTGNATSGVHDYTGLTGVGQYVRINSTAATTANPNISLYEFQVYGY